MKAFYAVAVYRKSKESCNAALFIKDQAGGNKKCIELASVPIKRFLLPLSPLFVEKLSAPQSAQVPYLILLKIWKKGEKKKKKKVRAGFCDMQTFVPFEF